MGLGILVGAGLLAVSVSAFNVDPGSSVIQDRPRGSCDQDCMFGFSVAQHSVSGTPWLLVGAPRADTGQPNVHKGGAVYKCPALRSGGCERIDFDKKGNRLTQQGKQFDLKSGQWFGAVVRSSGRDGTVLACGPRYVWFSRNYKRREPIGTCFIAKNSLGDFYEYSPCKTRKWGYHRQGSCQAGLGAAVAKNGEQIFIGAVGSWYWQGQVFSINTEQGRNATMNPANIDETYPPNAGIQQKTDEGDPQDDDSYLGYSVTTGEFNGDGDYLDVAVGMPRGSNLTGKVVLYDSQLRNLNNLTGTQIGAYFGYSLATADVNGDGLDDIVIGAPMWTNYAEMGKYETGRVYVVYQNREHRFRDYDTLDGENHKARFGMAVACLGDINLDGSGAGTNSLAAGYQDIAVGAPYDGANQRGAVYIYLGSADGIMKKPSQVIFARDLSMSLKTFGWSLSGGMDMDQNNYPDLLVGAYESGHAVSLRAAPVVHMTAEISFDRASKQISLEDASCTLKDRRTGVPCVYVNVDLRYTGIGVPNKLEYELEYVLDAKKETQKRMFFLDEEGSSVRKTQVEMLKERGFKDRVRVYLNGPNIKDKLTSLEVQVRYKLVQSPSIGAGLAPVLSLGDHMASDNINIENECGQDNICVPNLSVQPGETASYLLGSGENLELLADIVNQGEDAFNAMLELQLPRGVKYVNANTGDSGVSILCSPPSIRNNNTLQCEVGNPLRAGSRVTTTVVLQPVLEGLLEPISEFNFAMFARSSNPEGGRDDEDNVATVTVPIRVETDFRVTGLSTPDQVQYNISAPIPSRYEFKEEIGELVTHVYDVKNRGPSAIEEAEVYILWPSFNDYGDHLLYLIGYNNSESEARCEPIQNLNPLSLKSYSQQQQQTSMQVDTGRRPTNNRVPVVTRPPPVGGGAEETRLIDMFGEYYDNTDETAEVEDERRVQYASGFQANVGATTSDADILPSGWKRLPNGSFIRVYDQPSGQIDSSSGRSSQEEIQLSGSSQNTMQFNSGRRQEDDSIFEETGFRGSGQDESWRQQYSQSSSQSRGQTATSIGSSSSGGQSLNVLVNAARGPGDYHGTMSKSELEREAGGPVFSAADGTQTRAQVENTRYSGEGEDYVTTDKGRWVWSVQNEKWIWEEGAGQGTVDQSRTDSGWITLPNGTYVRRVSNWRQESSDGNYNRAGSSDRYGSSGGGGSSSSTNRDYFESGTLGGRYNSDRNANSGSSDSGWVLLANGSYVRQQQSWSSSGSAVNSGIGSGAVLPGGEYGDEGNNSTGWVRQPDGSYRKQSSSWASWSSSSSGSDEMGTNQLQDIQRRLEERARNNLNSMPGNVEPGFENQYIRKHRNTKNRKKRDLTDFQNELLECDSAKCTIIKCKIGPLEKGERVVFKVFSRLFTESLIKNYAEKVQISSKLLTRVTKLPFSVEENMLSFQSQTVTTTVIPSEPGEVGTPWWVYLLAVLAGILLLAAITYGLYKVGFFKRQRPDDSPEAAPLNGGY